MNNASGQERLKVEIEHTRYAQEYAQTLKSELEQARARIVYLESELTRERALNFAMRATIARTLGRDDYGARSPSQG